MWYHKEFVSDNKCSKYEPQRGFWRDKLCRSKLGRLKEGSLADSITLSFNKITNDFGLNWSRPIALIVILSLLFYGLLLLSLNVDNYVECLKYFFVFINPTHSVEFIAKGQWTWFSYFIDFAYRVVEALLLYQTVVAFRKFTKK